LSEPYLILAVKSEQTEVRGVVRDDKLLCRRYADWIYEVSEVTHPRPYEKSTLTVRYSVPSEYINGMKGGNLEKTLEGRIYKFMRNFKFLKF